MITGQPLEGCLGGKNDSLGLGPPLKGETWTPHFPKRLSFVTVRSPVLTGDKLVCWSAETGQY